MFKAGFPREDGRGHWDVVFEDELIPVNDPYTRAEIRRRAYNEICDTLMAWTSSNIPAGNVLVFGNIVLKFNHESDAMLCYLTFC